MDDIVKAVGAALGKLDPMVIILIAGNIYQWVSYRKDLNKKDERVDKLVESSNNLANVAKDLAGKIPQK